MAVAALAQTDGWLAALDLETAHWDKFVSTHPEVLLASIRALPGDAFVEVPSLLVAVNYLQHLISGVEPQRFHDVAHDDQSRPATKRQPLDRLIAATGRIAGHRTSGRLEEAARIAAEARKNLDQLPKREQAPLRQALPHLLTQWGRAFELTDSGGVREYEEAWDLARLTDQPEVARRAASSLAWLHADHGRLNEADRWIERAKTVVSPGARYDAPLYLALALTAGNRLDHVSVDEHLASLETVPVGEYWAAEAWVRAWVVSSEREAVRVESLIRDRVLAHPGHGTITGANHRYLTTARTWLATTRDRPAAPLPTPEQPSVFDHIMVAVTAYRSGTMHVVVRAAALTLDAGSTTRIRVAGYLLTAAAQLSLGRTAAASDAFISAHALIESERFLSSYSILDVDHLLALAELTGLDVHEAATSSRAGDATSNSSGLASLTTRERQMLTHLASDESLRKIGEAMFVSHNTVKALTRRVYRKLGVNSRRGAADIAHRNGLA